MVDSPKKYDACVKVGGVPTTRISGSTEVPARPPRFVSGESWSVLPQ